MKNMGTRTKYIKKNILWGNISSIVLSIFSFISRTVFIKVLGIKYLGVSGLFSNILGVLSFAQLGIGTAINYSLYKPIAENDDRKIVALMKLYKTAYRIIAMVVAMLGLLVYPFLDIFVNTDIPMDEIRVFYLIFLFNTVSSYFITYKSSYVSALQKNYVVTNINTIGQIVTYIIQLIFVVLTKSYIVYLMIQTVTGLLEKILMTIYLNRRYPILTAKSDYDIDKQTKQELIKNVKALIVHKIAEVSVHQTDNIIISMFIDTVKVGLVSNYTMLNSTIENFTSIIFNSFSASFGNLIAKDNKAKQREVFELYNFMGFWVYGFVFIAFVTLAQPFITLWIGKDMLVDDLTMVLYFISGYLLGQSRTVNVFKVAAGRFNEDKWIALVHALVNIVVSVWGVKTIGLAGVYVGTIAQRLIVLIVRPIVVYKYVLESSCLPYFKTFLLRSGLIALIALMMNWISRMVLNDICWGSFIQLVLLTAILPNIIIFFVYFRSELFKGVIARLR